MEPGCSRRHARRSSLTFLLLACLLAAGWPAAGASAQAVQAPAGTRATGPRWDPAATLRVPGGTSALLAAAGLDPGRSRAMAVLDIVRAVYRAPEGVEPGLDQRRTRLLAYLETIAEFERARTPFADGLVSVSGAANRTTRRRIEGFARAIGASLDENRQVYRLVPDTDADAVERRAWLKSAGLDVPALVAALNRGEAAAAALTADDVPLPLPESVWAALSGRPEVMAGATVATILGDRRAALLYYGAFAMDDETRRYLAASPALVEEIYSSGRSGAIALYGRSLRVRDRRIATPGGDQAVAIWESLVDERVTQPDRFILEVLGRDGGRLALLYDAVAHLDAAQQSYALGLWMPDAGRRADRFKALYSTATAAVVEAWNPAVRPFSRALYDPAELLLMARVEPDGRPGPIDLRRFWEKVFESGELPERPEDELRNVERDGVADAAWMMETVMLTSDRFRRERAEAWLFGHRVFHDAPVRSLPQVLIAVRGFITFRSLAATLERMGVSDPAVYVAAVRRAQRIAAIGDRDRAAAAHALYQGALVLVERARLSRAIDVEAAGRLVTSLATLPMSDGGEFLGAVAFWLDGEYLRAVGGVEAGPAAASGDDVIEARILSAFAGHRPAGAAGVNRVIEFEGIRYVVDPAIAELARLRAVRGKQGGPSLDAEILFARQVQTIASGLTDVSKIPARVLALQSAARALASARTAADARRSDLAEAVADASSALAKIKKPKDLPKAERISIPLRRVVDRGFARVLPSLAYACSIGDPEGTALLAGDPSERHDWGLLQVDEKARARTAWAIPAESREGGGRWRIAGSLLALDIAFANEALRRLSSETIPEVPTMTANDRHAFLEAVVLANAFDYADADMAAIADGIRRGRARVAVLGSVPSGLPQVLESAGLDEVRAQAIAWALVHERDRMPALFSLGDLLRLGQVPQGAVRAIDAWGTSGLSFDGRLSLRFPVSQPWTTLSGRQAMGITPTLVPDIALLIAETLSDQRLPAALTRPILAVATRDYLDRIQTAFDDDWVAMVAEVQRTVLGRMDDYLASVTTGGPLVPVAKGAGGGCQQ